MTQNKRGNIPALIARCVRVNIRKGWRISGGNWWCCYCRIWICSRDFGTCRSHRKIARSGRSFFPKAETFPQRPFPSKKFRSVEQVVALPLPKHTCDIWIKYMHCRRRHTTWLIQLFLKMVQQNPVTSMILWNWSANFKMVVFINLVPLPAAWWSFIFFSYQDTVLQK